MPLYSITYISTANEDMSLDEIKAILEISREKNAKQDITGMLLHHEGLFIQVVEGERDTVKALYRKIEQDPRHRSVLTVYEGVISERSFPDWRMGFKNIEPEEAAELEGFTDFLNQPYNPNHATKTRTQSLLDMFRARAQ